MFEHLAPTSTRLLARALLSLVIALLLASCGTLPLVSSGSPDAETDAAGCGLGGAVRCGSVCVDLQNDVNNCGVCGVACKSNELCAQVAARSLRVNDVAAQPDERPVLALQI